MISFKNLWNKWTGKKSVTEPVTPKPIIHNDYAPMPQPQPLIISGGYTAKPGKRPNPPRVYKVINTSSPTYILNDDQILTGMIINSNVADQPAAIFDGHGGSSGGGGATVDYGTSTDVDSASTYTDTSSGSFE